MRAISLHQPWATAVALGIKQIETRGWETGYRGALAIHAAARKPVFGELPLMTHGVSKVFTDAGYRSLLKLPRGVVVAVVQLTGCHATEELEPSAQESAWGNFAPDRYGWVLEKAQRLAHPIPWRGRQRWFDVPDSILQAALSAEVIA